VGTSRGKRYGWRKARLDGLGAGGCSWMSSIAQVQLLTAQSTQLQGPFSATMRSLAEFDRGHWRRRVPIPSSFDNLTPRATPDRRTYDTSKWDGPPWAEHKKNVRPPGVFTESQGHLPTSK